MKSNSPSQAIIGRTVAGVISKPVAGGRETLLILQFSDGSCFEFVSPRSAKIVDKITQLMRQPGAAATSAVPPQLSFFPQDGAQSPAATHLAA